MFISTTKAFTLRNLTHPTAENGKTTGDSYAELFVSQHFLWEYVGSGARRKKDHNMCYTLVYSMFTVASLALLHTIKMTRRDDASLSC